MQENKRKMRENICQRKRKKTPEGMSSALCDAVWSSMGFVEGASRTRSAAHAESRVLIFIRIEPEM